MSGVSDCIYLDCSCLASQPLCSQVLQLLGFWEVRFQIQEDFGTPEQLCVQLRRACCPHWSVWMLKRYPRTGTWSQISPLHRMQHRALQSPIHYREGLWGCVDKLKKSFLIYTAVCKFLTLMTPVALQLWPAQREGSWAAHLTHRIWCRYEGDVKGCFSLQQSHDSPVRAPLVARLSRVLPRAGTAPRSPMPGPCLRVTLASSLWSLDTFVQRLADKCMEKSMQDQDCWSELSYINVFSGQIIFERASLQQGSNDLVSWEEPVLF